MARGCRVCIVSPSASTCISGDGTPTPYCDSPRRLHRVSWLAGGFFELDPDTGDVLLAFYRSRPDTPARYVEIDGYPPLTLPTDTGVTPFLVMVPVTQLGGYVNLVSYGIVQVRGRELSPSLARSIAEDYAGAYRVPLHFIDLDDAWRRGKMEIRLRRGRIILERVVDSEIIKPIGHLKVKIEDEKD